MLGRKLPRLRTSLLTLAGLLLASGAAWAHGGGHGGGGHGGGGHGGGVHVGGYGHGGAYHYGGIGHVGGVYGGIGRVGGIGYGGIGRVGGVGFNGGFGRVGGVGFNGGFGFSGVNRNFGIYNPGFFRGLGYSPYFGRPFNSGFGLYGGGLGYRAGYYGLAFPRNFYFGGSGLGWGLGYPFSWMGLPYGMGLPYLGYNSGWYGGVYAPNYYGSGSSAYYGYSPNNVTPADYGMLASQAEAPPPPKDDLAHLLVIVPQNAELWFNGTKTSQTGPEREFISPELAPDKSYNYEIKARWTENGKTMEQARTVHVRANNWQVIDFTKPQPSPQEEK